MRIKYINRTMGILRGGGEIFALNIAKELARKGHELRFCIGKPLLSQVRYPLNEFPTDYCLWPALTLRTDLLRRGGWLFQRIDRWMFSMSCSLHLLRQPVDYDILHIFGTLPDFAWLKKRLQVPILIRFPGPPSDKYASLIRKFDAAMASGDSIAQARRIRPDTHLIQPGIDPERFKPKKSTDIRKQLGIEHNDMLLWVGRMHPIKRLNILIELIERLKIKRDVVLVAIGDGPLRLKWEQMVAQKGLEASVHFVGQVPNDLLPDYYAAADLFVLSSEYESFSIVTLEAMSCGKAVVCPDVGYLSELVKDGQGGFVLPDGDWASFEKHIITLLENKGLADQMGNHNRRFICDNFAWNRSAQQIESLYYELLNKSTIKR